MHVANPSAPKLLLRSLSLAMIVGFGISVQAQKAPAIVVGNARVTGVVHDWSQRHVVIPDPGSEEDAVRNGTYAKWSKIVNEPRYVMQQLRLGLPVRGPAAEDVAFRYSQGKFGKSRWTPTPPPGRSKGESNGLHTDWNISLGAGGVAQGAYPAKYAFNFPSDLTAANCTTDYAVFPVNTTTGNARAHVTGTFDTSTHFATGTNVVLTVTPTGSPAVTLTLTPSTSTNTGTDFQVVTTGPPGAAANTDAANLAAAINRNLYTVTGLGEIAAVVPTGAKNTVVVYALTPGTRVVLTQPSTDSTLTWSTVTAGTNGAQANIVGLNQLYSGTGTPLCTGLTFPEFIFSYASGVGPVATSPTLSLDGTEVAYVENDPNMGAILHVLTFASGSTEYGSACASSNVGTATPTCAKAAVIPGSTASSAGSDYMLPLGLVANATTGADTFSSPFVDYATDVAYVGDNGGFLYSITGVFLGTPKHAGGNFPVTVTTTAGALDISSPTVDVPGTGDIFVGDEDGYIYNYTSAGTLAAPRLGVGGTTASTTAGGVQDGPLIDSTNLRGYAVRGCNGTNSVLMQFSFSTSALTSLRAETLDTEGCTGGDQMYTAAPDNNYYVKGISSAAPASNGEITVCYTGTAGEGHMYLNQYQFTSSTMNAAAQYSNGFIAHGGAYECAPLNEFYNSNAALAVTGITQSGTTVTVTMASNPYPSAQAITIAGVTSGGSCSSALVSAINGAQTVASPTATTFTFTSTQSGTFASGCGLTSATAAGPADLLFFGVNYTTPEAYTFTLPLTSATQAPSATNALSSVFGGTSGMIVDNDTTDGQAASIYFGTQSNAAGTPCGAGNFCAVKLTQSALQ